MACVVIWEEKKVAIVAIRQTFFNRDSGDENVRPAYEILIWLLRKGSERRYY